MNAAGQQFGPERLVAELRAASAGDLSDGLRTVLRAVENWAGGTGPQDDISLIAMEIGS